VTRRAGNCAPLAPLVIPLLDTNRGPESDATHFGVPFQAKWYLKQCIIAIVFVDVRTSISKYFF